MAEKDPKKNIATIKEYKSAKLKIDDEDDGLDDDVIIVKQSQAEKVKKGIVKSVKELQKESARVGLGGLSLYEMVIGTMFGGAFQTLPDPITEVTSQLYLDNLEYALKRKYMYIKYDLICTTQLQESRRKWMKACPTAELTGWDDSTSATTESSREGDFDDDDDEVQVDEGSDEPAAKKAKPSAPSTTVNTEGLKQQAVTALRKMKMAMMEQAEAVSMLESVCSDTPLSQLPSLLTAIDKQLGHDVKTEVKAEVKEEQVKPEPGTSTPSTEQEEDKAKAVWISGSSYKCSKCEIMFGSKNGCDSHIAKKHTGIFHLCNFCDWSTANLDSLNRHVKKRHAHLE